MPTKPTPRELRKRAELRRKSKAWYGARSYQKRASERRAVRLVHVVVVGLAVVVVGVVAMLLR